MTTERVTHAARQCAGKTVVAGLGVGRDSRWTPVGSPGRLTFFAASKQPLKAYRQGKWWAF